MRFLLLIFALLASITGNADIAINTANFPDDNFRLFLLDKNYGKDGRLTAAEIDTIRRMSIDTDVVIVGGKNVHIDSISNLQGIEFFTALEELKCTGRKLETLDLSQNTALKTLYCGNNRLTVLDLRNNTRLTGLNCGNNRLTSLQLPVLKDMTWLYCYGNQLTQLDMTGFESLASLECSNNKLGMLSVSDCTQLNTLNCANNQLTQLDVTHNTKLKFLQCNNNRLPALNVSANTLLNSLWCNDNQLTSLDVSANTVLTFLSCSANKISDAGMDNLVGSLTTYEIEDPDNMPAKLRIFDPLNPNEYNVCTVNQVAEAKARGWQPLYFGKGRWLEYAGDGVEINETNFPEEAFRKYLKEKYPKFCEDNILLESEISFINVLVLEDKGIKTLKGVEYLRALEELNCRNNQLTDIDLSRNELLVTIHCDGNLLTTLDVSACDSLTFLSCYANQIRGNGMDGLIASLPQTKQDVTGTLRLLAPTNSNEGNLCTEPQAIAAKSHGWQPLFYNEKKWMAYNGMGIDINDENFPDESFRTCVAQQYPKFCEDGILQESEISFIDVLTLEDKGIRSLQGIEFFQSLKELNCRNNSLAAINLKSNRKLATLHCDGNRLTTLDLSACDSLTFLSCYANQIKDNGMDALIASLPKMKKGVTGTLRLLAPTNSNEGNQCTEQQVAAAANLGWPPLYFNEKEWLEYDGIGGEINEENFPDSKFRDYLMSEEFLKYTADKLLNGAEIAMIKEINVYDLGIASLKGIEHFTALTTLNCADNKLTGLDLSDNKALTFVNCSGNKIKGKAVESLIASLNKVDGGILRIYRQADNAEQNDSISYWQAVSVKDKGWAPQYYDRKDWQEFIDLRGDVNSDHKVNITDVTSIIDHILGRSPKEFFMEAADVNRSNSINITDVTTVIDAILNQK